MMTPLRNCATRSTSFTARARPGSPSTMGAFALWPRLVRSRHRATRVAGLHAAQLAAGPGFVAKKETVLRSHAKWFFYGKVAYLT
jgi:hypothetical protein